MLCGIDEAGRGCLAGPLVVAGVILKKPIKGLNDSKILSEKQREILYPQIVENSYYKIVFTDNQTIDNIGLSLAIKNSILEILKELNPSKTIMDGNTTFGIQNIEAIIKADATIAEVSAASILAKVNRDRYMIEQDAIYPEYEFKKHKGYGTALHISKIKEHGLSLLHRKSFKIKSLREPTLF